MAFSVTRLKKMFPSRTRGPRLRLGIHLAAETASAVLLQPQGERYRVLARDSVAIGPDGWASALPSLCQSLAPAGARVSIVLAPSFYSLLLVDTPPVDASELRDAVRFRIKDLVNIPLESLVVDAFALPPDAYRGRLNMIYAAATDRDLISKLARLDRAPYTLGGITIQELALLRVCCPVGSPGQGGTAILHMDRQSGAIFLAEGGELYLSRSLDAGGRDNGLSFGEVEGDPRLERLALDVQRSLDYYESQIGKPAPARLVWVGSEALDETLMAALQTRLAPRVMALDTGAVADWDTLHDQADQTRWALALGAVMQQEAADAAN